MDDPFLQKYQTSFIGRKIMKRIRCTVMYPEDKTPFKFYNVIPYSPGAEDLLAEEAIEYSL